MVANEVEQKVRLARCEMTQSVLDGQQGGVEPVANCRAFTLSTVAARTQLQPTVARWEWESPLPELPTFSKPEIQIFCEISCVSRLIASSKVVNHYED